MNKDAPASLLLLGRELLYFSQPLLALAVGGGDVF